MGGTAQTVSTEMGYVQVDLMNGWHLGEAKAHNSITLYNDGLGAADVCWITITDHQTGPGAQQEKGFVKYTFGSRQFSEVAVGGQTFDYISSEDGKHFVLIAETSTGKAMRVEAFGCTLDEALSLLTGMVIK